MFPILYKFNEAHHKLSSKFWRTSVRFVGPLIPLLWTYSDVCPWFQSQGDPLACVLHYLHATKSSDSPLVQHPLTSWRPSHFDPHTCPKALVGLESRISCATAPQGETTKDTLPTEQCRLGINPQTWTAYSGGLCYSSCLSCRIYWAFDQLRCQFKICVRSLIWKSTVVT